MAGPAGVRGLVFGALMAGLTVVLTWLVIFTPLLLFPAVVSLPVIMTYVRHGPRTATMSAAVAVVVATFLIGPGISLPITLASGVVPGLALGFALHNRFKPLLAGALTATVVTGVLLASLTIHKFALGIDLVAQMAQLPHQSMEQAIALIKPPAEQREAMLKTAQQLKDAVNYLFPLMLVGSGVWVAFGTYLLARWVLPRFGHPVEPITPFVLWRMPSWLVWLFVPSLALLFGGQYLGQPVLDRSGANFFFLLNMLYLIQGLSVGYWFLRERLVGKGVAVAALVFTAMIPAVQMVMTFVGLWDSIVNFRRIGIDTDR